MAKHERRTLNSIVPKTTKLSEDTAVSQTEESPKAAHADLEELIEIFGLEYGTELYRKGVDIEEARKYKELKEKFDLPDPASDETELNVEEDEEKVIEETVVEEKKEETTGLKVMLTALRKDFKTETKALRDEVTRLRAAIPRGELSPVSHGLEGGSATESKTPKTSIDRMAAKFADR